MDKSVAIVAGSYHKDKVEEMVEIVKNISSENNLLIEEVSWVPGSMEIPLQAKRLLLRESIDGLIVLGIIEKGETDHGLVMGQSVTKSIIDLQLASMKPIGFGIIGPGAEEKHISKRVKSHAKQATLAIVEMLSN
jgi:6,7-dimethyl-8-ribityllumazine synthase